jgi:hypothetical protein
VFVAVGVTVGVGVFVGVAAHATPFFIMTILVVTSTPNPLIAYVVVSLVVAGLRTVPVTPAIVSGHTWLSLPPLEE